MDTSFLQKPYAALLSDLERASSSYERKFLSRSCRSYLLGKAGTSEGIKVLAQSAKAFDSWLSDDENRVSDLGGGPDGPYHLLGRIFQNNGKFVPGGQTHSARFSDFARDISPSEVATIRQALRYLTKVQVATPKSNPEDVKRRFIELDNQCVEVDPGHRLIRTARQLVAEFLGRTSPYDILPKHGPGSVASGEKYYQKWHFRRLPLLNSVYPYHEYFVASHSHLADWGGDNYLNKVESRPWAYNRFCEVPKDVTKTRGICLELPEIQFIQQGILRNLDVRFRKLFVNTEHAEFGVCLMHDQSVNQALALRGSEDGSYTTLDLSDASDLISLDLVLKLFPERWHPALLATRSSWTKFPDGSFHRLKKFASMGSALCFPVECIVFWALSLASIKIAKQWRTTASHDKVDFRFETPSGVEVVNPCVSVFGDDIVVRSEYFGDVYDALKYCGLKPNWAKTFFDGGLRESCGADCYRGHWVTPVYLRKVATNGSRISSGVFSSVLAHANELCSRGYFDSSQFFLDSIRGGLDEIRTLYKRKRVDWDGVLPGREFLTVSACATQGPSGSLPARWNSSRHLWEYLVPDVSPVRRNSRVAGFDRLFQSLTLQSGDEPDFVSPRHETEFVLRWCSPTG